MRTPSSLGWENIDTLRFYLLQNKRQWDEVEES